VGCAVGGAAGAGDRNDPGFPGRELIRPKAGLPAMLPDKLLRCVIAGNASIIPRGAVLFVQYDSECCLRQL
jgi:hypothetical protein